MAELSSTTKEHAHKTPVSNTPAHGPLNSEDPELGVGGPEHGVVARHAALVGDPRLGSATGAQRMRLVQRLQRGYGNAYVARLVQRAVAEPPIAPAPATPQQDPKFVAVEQKIGQTAKQEKQHPPARSKAAEAQAAAHGPPNDIASQAAEKQVDKMSQQKPGEFDKKAFIAAVKKAIDASAPKNLEEADDFKKSGKAGQVKSEVSGMVGKGKQDSEGPIKKTNTESPDTSSATPKVVKPMADEKPGAAPPDPGAAQAIPSPKSAAETSMAAGPAQVNQDMSQAGVTEEQLKNSNEPQFTDAAAAKQGAEAQSKTAPLEYKAAENQTLDKAGADAKGAAGTALTGMHGDKQAVLGAVGGQKGGAKSKDEAKRAEVASKIEAIFNQTKTEVTAILDGLDGKVTTAFDAGEKNARDQFESFVDQKMTKYKADRYGGFFGAELWLKDKLMGMPSEVNAFYADGRNLYLSKMEGVISNVADVVGGELGKAKARIALGKQQVKEFVASQPKDLQQVAKEAEQQIGGKFDELEGEVNSKQDSLVQALADKYVAARGELDSRIDALKAENKGLVDKAIDAIGGVIKTILQLKDMLLGVLAKAANVIGDIIKDPIKFLGNLVSAIKMGLNQFGANIGKHLKGALMGWLFGTLGEAGIQLPESFDLKGIVSLVLQVLGLTYENVRAIAVKIAGEKVVAFVEGTVTFFTTLAKEGPAGLWQWIQNKIADLNLKEMVIGAIKDFVITKIITAGITWLISMLNPAAAFIKACKMIYDVIMFILERGAQIMEFVNSVLDGIGAIVAGSLGSAANLVENSLAKVLPLAIAFLASLLGVGGIAEKIKDIIEKIRAPITKLITAVVGPILKPMKALYAKGQKFVKGLADKGKAALKKGVDKVKGKFGGPKGQDGKPEDRERDAMKQVHSLLTNGRTSAADLRKALPKIKSTFGLASLTLTEGSISGGKEAVTVESRVARTMESGSVPAGGKDLDPLIYRALVSLAPEIYAGLPAPTPPSTEKPGPGKRVPTREEQQQAQAALLAQGRGRIESLGGTIQKALGNVQVAYGQAAHARVRAPLPTPTISTAPNLFSALGNKFFVDQQNNNYIVPASEAAKGINVDPSTLLIGTDPTVSSKYSYADAKNAINAIQMKGILLAIAGEPGGVMPRGRQLTMFLAAMVAEPSRYSVAQVTNLLAVSDPAAAGGNMVGSAGKLSMAQGGSDPKRGESVETDPRLAGVHPGKDMPKKVTDKDLAIVKGRKGLMDQIEKLNVPGASDEALVKGIAAILRGAIKDLETAHKSGGG